jgi:hypothetical protein
MTNLLTLALWLTNVNMVTCVMNKPTNEIWTIQVSNDMRDWFTPPSIEITRSNVIVMVPKNAPKLFFRGKKIR